MQPPPTLKSSLRSALRYLNLIWMTLDVGWFGLYTLSYYFMWLPDAMADRMHHAVRNAWQWGRALLRDTE